MSLRMARRVAWSVFGFAALCAVGSVVLAVLSARVGAPSTPEEIHDAVLMVALLAFPLVGAVIAARQPGNPIGWILLAIGLSWELGIGLAGGYVAYGFQSLSGGLPRPDLVSAVTSSAWVPAVGLTGTFLLLLFPDGRLSSLRWRSVAWVSAVVIGLLTLVSPFTPRSLRDLTADPTVPDIPNPLGIEFLRPLSGALDALIVVLLVCIGASAASLISRFRRARGQERLQMKWLAAGAGLTAFLYLALMASSGGEYMGWWEVPSWLRALEQLTFYSFILIPLSVGGAIMRYRLYDIDRIINRALVYGALTALLALIYVGGVVAVGGVARLFTSGQTNDLAIAASTLAIAGLFSPLRQRLQSFIDRRFYRSKYDAERTLTAFSVGLRNLVDLRSLTDEIVDVVNNTVEPEHVSLWLKDGTTRSVPPPEGLAS